MAAESLPVASKVVIPPTLHHASTTVHTIAAEDAPTTPDSTSVPPSPRTNNLDPQETTVSDGIVRAFLDAPPPPPPAPAPHNWKDALLASIGPPGPEERFVHSGWAHLRKRVADSMFRTVQADSRIRSFLTCGRGGWIERAKSDHTRTRLRVPHCHDRMCMVCGNHRSHRIRDALISQMANGPVSFITLTLCGRGEPLKELIERLLKHFRALRLHPTWADKVRGGAAMLEVKWSDKAKRWHPHLHIIADADYVPKWDLSDAWRSITKDSFVVDIQRVQKPATAAGYVAKYASKPMDPSVMMNPDRLDEAILALAGKRMCLCFGTWYGTPLSVAEDAELADDVIDADGYERVDPLWLILEKANEGHPYYVHLLINTPGAELLWRQSLLHPT